MKQNLILTGTAGKTETPFPKMYNLTEETGHRYISKEKGREGTGKWSHSKFSHFDYRSKRLSEKAKIEGFQQKIQHRN